MRYFVKGQVYKHMSSDDNVDPLIMYIMLTEDYDSSIVHIDCIDMWVRQDTGMLHHVELDGFVHINFLYSPDVELVTDPKELKLLQMYLL